MSKFKIRLKITGFELEMEGDRRDATQIPQQLSQQVAGFFQPAVEIASYGGNNSGMLDAQVVEQRHEKVVNARKPKKKNNSASSSPSKQTEVAIELKHDPNSWGNPKQDWKTAIKAIWLLYIVGKQTAVSEMTTQMIVSTFNLHFRQSGTITTSNVTRDLGKKKAATPSLLGTTVGEDGEKWFLTDAGLKEAEQLVAEGRGVTVANGS